MQLTSPNVWPCLSALPPLRWRRTAIPLLLLTSRSPLPRPSLACDMPTLPPAPIDPLACGPPPPPAATACHWG